MTPTLVTGHSVRTVSVSLPAFFSASRSQIVIPVSQDEKKGFGAPSKTARSNKPAKQCSGKAAEQKASVLREGSKELQSVLKSVEKDHSKKRAGHLNIDNNVAAKGKVDFVKVESWEAKDEKQSELENLKVKSFSPAFSFTDNNAPFYERLVHRLQLLESKGGLSVVHAKSLPPFAKWIFGERRYLQYLVDQHAVFDVLRFAVSSIEKSTSGDADSSEESNYRKAAMAIGNFNENLGLDRSKVLQNDIKALCRAMDATDIESLEPTTQTTAYVKYLKQLVRIACNEKDRKQACLQLLAHIFAIYVAHLTTGMRIGAKALDHIPVLKKAKAVSFYQDYPEHVTDPLKVFIAAVDKITESVSLQEDQEKVMEELPRAIQKTSLLLSVIAVEEQLGHDELSANLPVL